MNRLRRVLIFFISLLLFTSCIRVETIIKVNKDGSGTITETVMMSKMFTSMMRSFSEGFGDEEEKEEFSLFDKIKLTEAADEFGEGVEFVSGKEVDDKEWEGYKAVYSFDDVSKIRISADQEDKVDTGMSASPDEDENVEEEEFYYFSFKKGKTPQLVINRSDFENEETKDSEMEEEAMEGENGDLDGGGMDMMTSEMAGMFKGMRFSMKLEVNGKVRKTNATYRDKSTITLLDMDFAEMMKNEDAFSKLTSKKPESTAELQAFAEKFDGFMIELEQPVTVDFK